MLKKGQYEYTGENVAFLQLQQISSINIQMHVQSLVGLSVSPGLGLLKTAVGVSMVNKKSDSHDTSTSLSQKGENEQIWGNARFLQVW